MRRSLPLSLRFKASLIGTPIETIAKQARWLSGAVQRSRHPELWELYLEDLRLPEVLQRLLKRDSDVIDVGAHIGSFLSLALHCAPDGHHAAIEPSAKKAAWLRKRFPRQRVMQIAIADSNGSALFEENPGRPGYSRLQGTVVQKDVMRYEVTTRMLDYLFDRADLIKLDVEGGELAALRGGKTLITKSRPAILFECGHNYPPQQTDRQGIYNLLTAELGYAVFTFGDFLFHKGPLGYDEFRKCGLYPFRAFNYVALPQS